MRQYNVPRFGHISTFLQADGKWSARIVVNGGPVAFADGYDSEAMAIGGLVDQLNELAALVTRIGVKVARQGGN